MSKFSFNGIFPIRHMLRFVTVGAFCTALSLTLNFIFLKFFETPLIPTYILIYIATILVSFVLNSHFTFDARVSVQNAVLYFGIYLTAMGLGVLLLTFYKNVFNFENWVYPFMSAPFTMLWNYHWSSRLLKKKVL